MRKKYCLSMLTAIVFSMFAACGAYEQSGSKETKEISRTEAESESAAVSVESEDDSSLLPTQADRENEYEQELTFRLTDSMQVEEMGQLIHQTDSVNGISYSLTINLEKAAGYTSREQIITCTKVFWYCYPKMYEKMAVPTTPLDVILFIEDEGYEIAEQWENKVHLHDRWLCNNPRDYDCLTHEFAHVIQSNWDGEYSPHYGDDAYLIERFADACRYMYAYEGGKYNNEVWTLHTPAIEGDYSSSNRFWVWLEQTYSNDKVDIFKRLVEESQIMDEAHEYSNWDDDGSMWKLIFDGTKAQGKSLSELWLEFLNTEFAWEESF